MENVEKTKKDRRLKVQRENRGTIEAGSKVLFGGGRLGAFVGILGVLLRAQNGKEREGNAKTGGE